MAQGGLTTASAVGNTLPATEPKTQHGLAGMETWLLLPARPRHGTVSRLYGQDRPPESWGRAERHETTRSSKTQTSAGVPTHWVLHAPATGTATRVPAATACPGTLRVDPEQPPAPAQLPARDSHQAQRAALATPGDMTAGTNGFGAA